MRTLLKIAKRISNKVLGTTSDLLFWRFRHFIDRRWPENYVSKQSLAHPHRSLLVEKISKYNHPALPKTAASEVFRHRPKRFGHSNRQKIPRTPEDKER